MPGLICAMYALAFSADAMFDVIDSSHKPSRVKMCDGICSA